MDDPYSKVFDSKAMNEKRMSLRGKELTTGLKLNKVMHWNRFADALLDVFGINVILQPFYAIGNKLRVVKGIEASDLHRSQGSRIRSSNGYSGKGLMSYVPFHRATLNSAILSSQNISIALPSRLADTFKLYGLLVLPAIAVIDRRVAMRKATLVLGVAGFARQFYLMLDDSLSSIVIDEISSNCVHSGLVVGDQIVALNGQAIRRSSAKKVLKKLNFGDVGDLVDLTIRRTNQTADGNPFYHTYQVLRDFAPVVTVTHGVLPPQQNCGIGYLSIRQFTDESFNEVVSAIKALKKSIKVEQGLPMKALIIDLRDNPGGSLLPALDIASLFLRRGTLLMQVGVSGRIIKHWSRNWFADKKLSLLLLTNARTASASEILVEALSDNERACTMGARTVGKNVMQAVVALSDGTGICFTIREFYSPTGRYILIYTSFELFNIFHTSTLGLWEMVILQDWL